MPGDTLKVAVLLGGIGPEREVSCASGAAVVAALAGAGWEVVPVEITNQGDFVIDENVETPAEAVRKLALRGVEAVFVALHGPWGEDGAVQGFLTVARLPFVGPAVESAACAMNKHVTRLLLADAGIPVPHGVFLRRGEPVPAALPLPAVVKPCRLGSSVGVRLVTTAAERADAIAAVMAMDQDCIVEELVVGREFSCPVWERRSGVVALPVIEIKPARGRPFFDYEAKYETGQAEEIVHAESGALFDRLKSLAVACHRILGCRHFSRTDMIVEEGRGPVVLETNTIPGLTTNSLLPKALAAAGYSLADLAAESLIMAAGSPVTA
jgi:D-alanine-D-alanine ligase